MLDSGAFSAWTRGEAIDLDEYISFLQQHEHLLESYISLDVIPERGGGLREVDRAATASMRNYDRMRSAGLDPIPVFHYGESFKWLERLLDTGAEYIAIGGTAVGVRGSTRRRFFDECFTVLTDDRGNPLVRVHGLGLTDVSMVSRYPWYSVDSTSWLLTPSFGAIVTDTGSVDVNQLTAHAKALFLCRLRKFGITDDCALDDVYIRTLLSVEAHLEMKAAEVFKHKSSSFFRPQKSTFRDGRRDMGFCMFFAGSTGLNHERVLRMHGERTLWRLWSYYDVRGTNTLVTRQPLDVSPYNTHMNSALARTRASQEGAQSPWTGKSS